VTDIDGPRAVVALDSVRLAAARLRAADAQPFLAVALYALTPVAKPGSGTFAVDERWRLYIDPDALANWTVEENAGVLLHEVGHLVREHAARARSCGVFEPTALTWNIGADAEINDDLRTDLVRLPDSPVFPETLGLPGGKAAEYYFDQLLDRQWEIEPPDCGTGCHGVAGEADRGVFLAHGADVDELRDHPEGVSEAEALLIRRRVAEEVVRMAVGRLAGSVPGGWERWASALLRPQVDWRRVLSGAIRSGVAAITGSVDYSYRRPSRRRVPGVVLPSLHRPLPVVSIVIDTSASMHQQLLDAAWSEVRGCLRSLGVRRDLLRVYATDVDTRRVRRVDAEKVSLIGGGGTDLREGIEFAMKERPRPDLVVVLTDGYTPWPDRAPRAEVIVGLIALAEDVDEEWDDDFGVPESPPWARTVFIRAPA